VVRGSGERVRERSGRPCRSVALSWASAGPQRACCETDPWAVFTAPSVYLHDILGWWPGGKKRLNEKAAAVPFNNKKNGFSLYNRTISLLGFFIKNKSKRESIFHLNYQVISH
jgi:hypothetical protein